MFIPSAARVHYGCVIFVRILQGLVEVRHCQRCVTAVCFILCYFIFFIVCMNKKSAMNLFSHFIRSLYNFSSGENKEYGVQFNEMRDALY